MKRESQPHASTRVYGERIATGEGKSGQPWAAWTCQQDCRQLWSCVPRALRPRSGGSRGLQTRGSARNRRGPVRKRSDLPGARGLALLRKPGAPWTRSRRAASRTSDAETRHARRHAAPAAKDAAAKPDAARIKESPSGVGHTTARATRRSSTGPRSGRRGAGVNRRRCRTRTWPTT